MAEGGAKKKLWEAQKEFLQMPHRLLYINSKDWLVLQKYKQNDRTYRKHDLRN